MERIERGFVAGIEQVRTARSFAQGALGAWGLESSEVVLVVSELSANAVRHAKSAFILALSFTGTTLTVEVTDASPALATMARRPDDGTSGRGLLIVDHLARAWGSHPTGSGKTVWAELDTRSSSARTV